MLCTGIKVHPKICVHIPQIFLLLKQSKTFILVFLIGFLLSVQSTAASCISFVLNILTGHLQRQVKFRQPIQQHDRYIDMHHSNNVLHPLNMCIAYNHARDCLRHVQPSLAAYRDMTLVMMCAEACTLLNFLRLSQLTNSNSMLLLVVKYI